MPRPRKALTLNAALKNLNKLISEIEHSADIRENRGQYDDADALMDFRDSLCRARSKYINGEET